MRYKARRAKAAPRPRLALSPADNFDFERAGIVIPAEHTDNYRALDVPWLYGCRTPIPWPPRGAQVDWFTPVKVTT